MKEEITEDNFVVEDPLRTQNQKKTGGKNSKLYKCDECDKYCKGSFEIKYHTFYHTYYHKKGILNLLSGSF